MATKKTAGKTLGKAPANRGHKRDPLPPSANGDEAGADAAIADRMPVLPAHAFPIVGIGASAGGLAAFEAFFSGMPAGAEPGMAFVLVQHLAPDHKSILAELVQRYTRMRVFEVEDGVAVAPNCVYIIPPARDLAFLNGTLQLLEPEAPRGQRLPIDFFFRSLAADLHERAIGIVLSGTGSDGTFGVRAIKGEGGMVMAQDPDSTEFDGMPRSAIATGMVDFELPPAEMPARLIAYAKHAYGTLPRLVADPARKTESALNKIFLLLRAQTGHDFSLYKPSTVNRRIERRLAVNEIVSLESYVKYLQQTPLEVQALFRDMLIGVTNFFRDAEAFAALEAQAISAIFAAKPPGAAIRIWVPGCATGEEAYSIAILLAEQMEAARQNRPVQLFATDIDAQAIAIGRAGIYPASIAADMSRGRLARFFSPEPGGAYRIHKSLRDMLIFSEQDVIRDPPFSRLDLISCRNLLIYFGAELQKKLIPLFHYALNPGGMLFLGTSENVGEFAVLFAALNPKAKLYQRKDDAQAEQRAALGQFLPPLMGLPRAAGKPASPAKTPLRELTEQALLQQLAPAGALINAQGDILYLHGRTGLYLEPAAGEAGINNILKMAREGLRPGLDIALHQAAATKNVVRTPGLRVKTNSHHTLVNLSIRPLAIGAGMPPEPPLYLVILEEAPDADPASAQPLAGVAVNAEAGAEAAARIVALTQELRARDEYLQGTREELESSTEELRSTNEEMQSVNEELQSTNEELETSKEELQSLNEELATVNTELLTKVADLSRANDDMNNLLQGTGIATIFADRQLRILRFTPTATQILNLIQGDIGRPVAHVVSKLAGYARLQQDAQAVLDTLLPVDTEVRTEEGKCYAMHIGPYRTLNNVIGGVVLTFVDITETERVREALRLANEQMRLAVVVRDAHDAITVQDLEGRIVAWNPGAVRMYGWSEAEALALNVRQRIPQELREQALATLHQLSQSEILEPYRTQRLAKGGAVLDVWITATALINEAGQMYAIATTERGGEMTEARDERQR